MCFFSLSSTVSSEAHADKIVTVVKQNARKNVERLRGVRTFNFRLKVGQKALED